MTHQELATKLYQISQKSFLEGSPWNEEQFLGFLEGEYNLFFLMEEKEEIVGFVLLSVIFDEAELVLIAVNKANQRQGIAQNLLKRSCTHLIKNEVKSLFIEVRKSNMNAQQLYLKAGFKEIATRKNYYEHPKEDALIWQLLL